MTWKDKGFPYKPEDNPWMRREGHLGSVCLKDPPSPDPDCPYCHGGNFSPDCYILPVRYLWMPPRHMCRFLAWVGHCSITEGDMAGNCICQWPEWDKRANACVDAMEKAICDEPGRLNSDLFPARYAKLKAIAAEHGFTWEGDDV